MVESDSLRIWEFDYDSIDRYEGNFASERVCFDQLLTCTRVVNHNVTKLSTRHLRQSQEMLLVLNSEEGTKLSMYLRSLELRVGRIEVAIDESFDVGKCPCVSLLSLNLGIDLLFFLFQLSNLG